jgi:uncharacterized protein (DUF1015 family)
MAIVAPFRGITYNSSRLNDFSKLVAPPYDVISEEGQEAYYRAHEYNVIRLILGKKKTGDSDWDNRYTRSADTFRRWEAQRILVRSSYPSIYLTSLTYDPGDGAARRTRWGIILLVRIEEEGSKVILPHERTFSAHKDDRLKLMRACGAQLSQIFGLYESKDDAVLNACRGALAHSHPLVSIDQEDGTRHALWVLQDPSIFTKVAESLRDRSIFIADGHHRYETARNYRNLMRARYGRRPENRSYEFVMMYLTNMDDEGLTILPTHRLLRRSPVSESGELLDRIGAFFEIEPLDLPEGKVSSLWPRVRERLERRGMENTVIAFYPSGGGRCYFLTLRPGAKDQMGEDLHPSLKELDVLVLSRFVFQKGFGFRKEDMDNEEIIQYESNGSHAASLVESGACRMAFFLNPTRIEQVKEVAGNFQVMPRKSTYFYPKVLTGLVFNKLDPHEIIAFPRG